MTLRRLVLIAAALVVSAAAAGCGDSGGSSSSGGGGQNGGGAAGGANAVTIMNFRFQPDPVQVRVGTAITWTNQDSATHTSTADDGTWDSKDLAQGKTFSFTFSKAGTFKYHCTIHNYMTGTITAS